MTKHLLLPFFFLSFYCNAQNSWTQKASVPISGPAGACAFSIGNYGYVCTGGDGGPYSTDVWRYDATGNSWIQRASVGTIGRIGAVGFSVNGYGYVCLGLNDSNNLVNDVWQYNPATNM